jgi:hypothetical protein
MNKGWATHCACLHARAQKKTEEGWRGGHRISAAQHKASLSCTAMHWCSHALHSFSAASQPTFLRQKPQLQQPTQPAPQEPRQQGHHQPLLASAASQSSPWRFLRHLALQKHRNSEGRCCQDALKKSTAVGEVAIRVHVLAGQCNRACLLQAVRLVDARSVQVRYSV